MSLPVVQDAAVLGVLAEHRVEGRVAALYIYTLCMYIYIYSVLSHIVMLGYDIL